MPKYKTMLPKIYLDTAKIATRADTLGLWCMRGEPLVLEYIVNDKNVLVMSSSSGYLVIPHEYIDQVTLELQSIQENLKSIKESVERS